MLCTEVRSLVSNLLSEQLMHPSCSCRDPALQMDVTGSVVEYILSLRILTDTSPGSSPACGCRAC